MEGQDKSTVKQILLIIMSLVFLTITYYVFSNLVFDMGKNAIKLNFLERENTEVSIARIKNASNKIIPIDVDIFEDEKFLELSEMSEKTVELEKHKLGKKNPFEISSSTKDELIEIGSSTKDELIEIGSSTKDELIETEENDENIELLDIDDIEGDENIEILDNGDIEDNATSSEAEINNKENQENESLQAEGGSSEVEMNNDIDKYDNE